MVSLHSYPYFRPEMKALSTIFISGSFFILVIYSSTETLVEKRVGTNAPYPTKQRRVMAGICFVNQAVIASTKLSDQVLRKRHKTTSL